MQQEAYQIFQIKQAKILTYKIQLFKKFFGRWRGPLNLDDCASVMDLTSIVNNAIKLGIS